MRSTFILSVSTTGAPFHSATSFGQNKTASWLWPDWVYTLQASPFTCIGMTCQLTVLAVRHYWAKQVPWPPACSRPRGSWSMVKPTTSISPSSVAYWLDSDYPPTDEYRLRNFEYRGIGIMSKPTLIGSVSSRLSFKNYEVLLKYSQVRFFLELKLY